MNRGPKCGYAGPFTHPSANAAPHLFQYMDADGRPQPVDSSDVNHWLRDVMGGDFSAKDFRIWGASSMAFARDAAIPASRAQGASKAQGLSFGTPPRGVISRHAWYRGASRTACVLPENYLKRHPFLGLPLALLAISSQAAVAADKPPAEYATYLSAVRKADAIADPLQRCLAYPDLPGNTWAPEIAKARCTMFLTPPRHTLDDIEKKLSQPGGAEMLESHFEALLDAHYVDPAQREQISTAFRVFSDADRDKVERVARKWLAAMPRSSFARTALGHALAGRGWDARGTKYVRDTPADNLQSMNRYFLAAAQEYAVAMEANPKLLPACRGLMGIGRQSSSEAQAYATQKCLDADPNSYYVVDEMMTSAEPRWGGSDAAMRSVSAYAQARAAQNPVLGLFAFHHASYEIERMEDGDAQALAVLEPASLQVPNAAFLRMVGGAYLRKGDNWKALVFLSQALRFSPQYAQESRFRALALRRVGETRWARADAERAVALDPDNGHALQLLGEILREVEGASAAAPYFKRAIADEKTREYAYNDYCGVLLDAMRLQDAGTCIDELIAAYPGNPEAWRQKLFLIGFDAPGSREAMERFLALQDPGRWSYHAKAAKVIRMVQASKEGKASPDEMVEARAVRAQALERTLAGRSYFETLKASPENHLGKALGACNPTAKAGGGAQFDAIVDVRADGSVTNVVVRPVNAWTTCIAKHVESSWKLPPPPKLADSPAYPLIYQVKLK